METKRANQGYLLRQGFAVGGVFYKRRRRRKPN